MVERNLFEKIGMLDEKFDFYYSDNDYSMLLYKNQIKHALCTKSQVKHLGSKNSTELGINHNIIKKSKKEQELNKLPKYLQNSDNAWILENPKMLDRKSVV